MDDLTELRAALIQLSKTLETQRACVLRILKVVERQMETGQSVPVAVSIMQRSMNDNLQP